MCRKDVYGTMEVDCFEGSNDDNDPLNDVGKPHGGDSFDAQQCILDGYSAVPVNYGGNSYNDYPNSFSTGRSQPMSLEE